MASDPNNHTPLKQLQKDLHTELIKANQLIVLISAELDYIKKYTSKDSHFEVNIKQNAKLIEKLASLRKIDLNSLPFAEERHLNPDNIEE